MSLVTAAVAVPQVLVSPVRAFSSRRHESGAAWILLFIVVLTALAASASNPPTIAILQATPAIAASPAFARALVWTQSLVLTPLGTAAFLLVVAVALWAMALLMSGDAPFGLMASIAFLAGGVGVLKRLFVAAVLYVRWWLQPSTLGDEITTGLDGFIPHDLSATFPLSVLRETGLFELWFFVLLGIGLKYQAGLDRRIAIAIAGGTAAIVTAGRVAIAAMTNS